FCAILGRVDRDSYKPDVLPCVRLRESSEPRQLVLAWLTPGGPEVEHDGLAAQRGELLRPSAEVFQRELRRRFCARDGCQHREHANDEDTLKANHDSSLEAVRITGEPHVLREGCVAVCAVDLIGNAGGAVAMDRLEDAGAQDVGVAAVLHTGAGRDSEAGTAEAVVVIGKQISRGYAFIPW